MCNQVLILTCWQANKTGPVANPSLRSAAEGFPSWLAPVVKSKTSSTSCRMKRNEPLTRHPSGDSHHFSTESHGLKDTKDAWQRTWNAMPTFLPYWYAISWTSGSEFTRMETLRGRGGTHSQRRDVWFRNGGRSPSLLHWCRDRTYILLYSCSRWGSPSSWRSSPGSAWISRSRSPWSPAAWILLEDNGGR